MFISYDDTADALYIRLVEGEPVARTERVEAGTLVDVDRLGRPVGIEVLHPARSWPLDEVLKNFSVGETDSALLRGMWNAEKPLPFARPPVVAAS